MTPGEKVQELRKSRGISQESMAGELGVSRQAVSKWERDEAMPDVEKLLAISRFFGITIDELLTGTVQTQDANNREAENGRNLKKKKRYVILPAVLVFIAALIVCICALTSGTKTVFWITTVLWQLFNIGLLILFIVLCVMVGKALKKYLNTK